jgi:hypothetical protein
MPLVVFCLLLTTLLPLAAAEYHVDAERGDDAAAGGAEAPWRSVRHACKQVAPGDTVLVHPGIYDDHSHGDAWHQVYIARGGRPDAWVTIRGLRDVYGNRPRIVSASVSAIALNGASYVTVEGFELVPVEGDPLDLVGSLKWASEAKRGITVVRTKDGGPDPVPSHIRIVDNLVRDFGDNGISIALADQVLVQGNIVEHCAFLTDNGNSGISVSDMRVRKGVEPLAELRGYGLAIVGNICRFNVNLRGFKGYHRQLTDGQGIILDYLNDKGQYPHRTLIANNVCYGNGARGINLFHSHHVDLAHNTCFDNLHSVDSGGRAVKVAFAADGEIGIQSSSDIKLVNNLVVARADRPGIQIGGAKSVVQAGNLHWNEAGIAAAGLDPADRFANPLLRAAYRLAPHHARLLATTMGESLDLETASARLRWPSDRRTGPFPLPDLQLLPHSPALGAGLRDALGVKTLLEDIDGRPRNPTSLDVGAYQMSTGQTVGGGTR